MIKDEDMDFTFIEGKTYYMVDRFDDRPIFVELECEKIDPDDWDYEYGLKEKRHILPNKYPLGRYTHPLDIASENYTSSERKTILSKYFFNSFSKAAKRAVEICFDPWY